MVSGLALVDKPQDITSFDVVAKLRKVFGTRKVGHAGTLDPMATGLMLVGVNQGTKLLQFLVGMDKQYLATIRLGAATVSDDAQGEVVSQFDASGITDEQVDSEIAKLRGAISQVPSKVSAKKIDGKRAYDLVRSGEEFELKPKEVVIQSFERTSEIRFKESFADFDVLVECTSGTYIRALARDIGTALGVGGHLTMLKRTKIGNFSVEQADAIGPDVKLLALRAAAESIYPPYEISDQQVAEVRHGKPLSLQSEEPILSVCHQGELVAISKLERGLYRSQIVVNQE